MTREEAIEIFLNRGWITLEGGTYFDGDKWREAIMVISDYFQNEYKALEQEPCEDAISREAAVNAIYDLCGENVSLKENPFRDNPHMDAVVDELENLPSVTPQQKMGRWIEDDMTYCGIGLVNYKCDKCGEMGGSWIKGLKPDKLPKYCMNCGVRMEVEE